MTDVDRLICQDGNITTKQSSGDNGLVDRLLS